MSGWRGLLLGVIGLGAGMLAVGCGSAESEQTAASVTVPAATETPDDGVTSTATVADDGRGDVMDRAPQTLLGPRLTSFDGGLLAWGLTSSGDGAVAVIDAPTSGWYRVEHAGAIPYCGTAVALDGDAVLIGNASTDSDEVVGLVVDIGAGTAEPFEVPDLLDGRCPSAVATSTGLIAWTTEPDAELPVTAASFDLATRAWDELPPPPLPTGTYETGGVHDGENLILIGSTEGQPNLVGASLSLADQTWSPLPDAPIATWEGPQLIWTGREVLVTSAWPHLITGGETDPFPEPLAPGGSYDPDSGTWRASSLAPAWTDGIPVWTGDHVIWWQPGREHGTVYDPDSDRWWHIPGPTFGLPLDDHDTLWAGTWVDRHLVVTDGSSVYSWTPDTSTVVDLDRSGRPRTDRPLDPGAAAGTRTGDLGLLGQACGVRGRNTVTVTVTESNDFSLDYVIDREEPCGSVIVHEGTITGSIDVERRTFSGSGEGTVDGRPVVVACDCEITADNRIVGELTVDGVPTFIVAFVDG